MTDDTMAFFNLVRERGSGDLLKDLAEAVLQRLMEYDVENLVGAARYERNEARTTQRTERFRQLSRVLATRSGRERHSRYWPNGAAWPAVWQWPDWRRGRCSATRIERRLWSEGDGSGGA
jgi:hypothetical protein